jgi:hypothetical protein
MAISGARRTIWLETSSYLPLIWRTPYSRSVVEILGRYATEYDFALQRDCVKEAAGYLSFPDNHWQYHPAVRFRRLIQRIPQDRLRRLSYPSTAVQLLLGGNIWPKAQYLNFVRHTAFFFMDLLDGVCFDDPARGLEECAVRIEERVNEFRRKFREHEQASELRLPAVDLLPYWGYWYVEPPEKPFTVALVDDPRPYNKTTEKLRDIFHYECASNATPPASRMLVANTGFERNVKTSFIELRCPIECARACSPDFFGD